MNRLRAHTPETLERKICLLQEDFLAEIETYVDFLLYRQNTAQRTKEKQDVSAFFGSVKAFGDGLEYQRRIRNEWE